MKERIDFERFMPTSGNSNVHAVVPVAWPVIDCVSLGKILVNLYVDPPPTLFSE